MTGLLAGALYLGAAVFALQVVDAITAVIEARMVRDDEEPDAITRTRLRETFWTIAVTAVLAVFAAFAVDAAGELILDRDAVGGGVLVLLGTAAAAFAVGFVAVVAVLRREPPSFARIRRDLRDRPIPALDADELAAVEARLARADQLARRRPRADAALRVLALAVVTAVVVIAIVAAALGGAPALAVLAAAILLVDVAAFVVAMRAALLRQARLDAVLSAQRAEVIALLERARIPRRGRVPGLRDRVGRALAILREKQR